MTLLLESLRKTATNAHRNTSFDPEKRADQFIKSYSDELSQDLVTLPEQDREEYIKKYTDKLSSYLHSRSNVASTMITGPANFNVRKNEKANRAADNKYNDFRSWRTRVQEAIEKKIQKAKPAQTILAERWEEISKSITKSAQVVINIDNGTDTAWSRVLFVNSITGLVKRLAEKGETELASKSLDLIRELNSKGVKPVITSKNKIWDLFVASQAVEIKIQVQMEKENDQIRFAGGMIIINHGLNRVQIKHDCKPDRDIITALKKNAFKWSPTQQVWQRQLTGNALHAAKSLVSITVF